MAIASESTHWYDRDGNPRYTIVGANGKERNTTLRDARTQGYVPSVTTIIRCAAAPALEKWKRNQVLLAALTLPRMPDESEADWLARVEQDWQEQGKAAAERGTAIHAAIERAIGKLTFAEQWQRFVDAATLALPAAEHWSAERSFAHSFGYGGKTDLHNFDWVIDVKTKDGELPAKLFDDHLMQLAAYRHGLGLTDARCGILFVGRDQPVASFVEASADDLTRGWGMFAALLDYWYAKSGLTR